VSARAMMLLAAGGSAGLLAAAFAFQHLGGLAPCPICLWQRWPHAAAVAIGALALIRPAPWIAAAGGMAAAATAAIGLYHPGIERGWWPGPQSCAGGGAGLSGLSGEALLSPEAAPALVMCDEVVWSLAGLSMASWNGLLSLALAVLWLVAARRAVSGRAVSGS